MMRVLRVVAHVKFYDAAVRDVDGMFFPVLRLSPRVIGEEVSFYFLLFLWINFHLFLCGCFPRGRSDAEQ